METREARDKVTKRRTGKGWNGGRGSGAQGYGGRAVTGYMCRGPEFLIAPLLLGSVWPV